MLSLESRNRLSALMSLWMIFLLWMWFSARSDCERVEGPQVQAAHYT